MFCGVLQDVAGELAQHAEPDEQHEQQPGLAAQGAEEEGQAQLARPLLQQEGEDARRQGARSGGGGGGGARVLRSVPALPVCHRNGLTSTLTTISVSQQRNM